jgi:hypothetical protein
MVSRAIWKKTYTREFFKDFRTCAILIVFEKLTRVFEKH